MRNHRFVGRRERLTTGQDEIYGSAYASAVYLSSVAKLPKNKKVYVIGMSGIEQELKEEGITYVGGTVRIFVSW